MVVGIGGDGSSAGLKQHDSQRDYPIQPLDNSIDLAERNEALNTMPGRAEASGEKQTKNTLLLHGSSVISAEAEAYTMR